MQLCYPPVVTYIKHGFPRTLCGHRHTGDLQDFSCTTRLGDIARVYLHFRTTLPLGHTNLPYVFPYIWLALASDVSIVSDMQHGTPSTGLQQKFTLTLNSQNVQAVMNRQGLSVTELARRANVSRGELAKSIKGEYLASWKTIGRVAEALEVHPAAISTWNVAP